MKQITIEELQLQQGSSAGVVIDIRGQADYDKGTFPGAVHADADQIRADSTLLPMDRPVYFLCYTGEESDELACEMEEKGYDAYSVAGGYHSYLRVRLQKVMHPPGEAVKGELPQGQQPKGRTQAAAPQSSAQETNGVQADSVQMSGGQTGGVQTNSTQ
ncbi:MAG: rhodanese-like domain-containing protein, partial [Lachnospiraceae bacterium]|nr:rhodanese-like domain-containing protein [Lachnospiraceae bacterium]